MILTFSKVCKFNILPFAKSYSFFDWTLAKGRYEEELQRLGLPEFHPVCNIYQTGYVHDNKEVETSRPYQIIAKEKYVFDFKKFMRTKSGMHDFEFDSVEEKELQGTLTSLGDEKYEYNPPDHDAVEKIYAVYKDKTTQSKTKTIVRFRQIYNGTKLYFKVPSDDFLSIQNYYQEFVPFEEDKYHVMFSNDAMSIPEFDEQKNSSRTLICLAEGAYFAPKTAKYKFFFSTNRRFLFYMSQNPFRNTIEEETDTRKWIGSAQYQGFNTRNGFNIYLEEGKKYYYRIVIMDGSGAPTISTKYYLNDDSSKWYDVEGEFSRFSHLDLEDRSSYVFTPEIENIPTLGIYWDERNIRYTSKIYNLTSKPNLDNNQDLSQTIFEVNNEENDCKSSSSFPISYKFTSFTKIRVDKMMIKSSSEMDSDIEIICGKEICYDGKYNSEEPNITLIKTYDVKEFEIKVKSNSKGSYSSICTIVPLFLISDSRNIIPSTHTKFVKEGEAELTKHGLYYNGKGFHMKEGSSIKFTVSFNETGNSVGFVGDKSVNGGTFDVFVDGKFNCRINTSVFLSNELR
ncbi:Immuno-dominant variable surface antigen-like [Trichomonas vaginalis G3]|uniref:Immuno-dominant variable surface antigen-like n=1 Tax=Trichomonas vaginalis (strain ATCC PRA-98 / G3) TaxID=412133 RepID=A2DKX6_TRIV3|nr:experimental autoimmune prostatitis antigen 2-related family [Trichomonas vaginalis G3]EAY18929.1 Immuno-dominant variable surface antigen-like [Trichomonas vaginalis G3]KAI5531990.1 experimental autoimmune prostatitis antigen 2-related family [Trichomonas vaginalis G3]|eukprot:XP_001579915.1 Immuno-dominant variable surface antigen-like [Trichomonas vaginalis G3]